MCIAGINRNFYDFKKTSEMVFNLLGQLDKQKIRKDLFEKFDGEGEKNGLQKIDISFSMTYTERTIELLCNLAQNFKIWPKKG